MRRSIALAACVVLGAACSSSDAERATVDPRVHSLQGRPPAELAPDARWLNAPPASLASLRGRVLFVQFAFPT